MVSVEVFDPPMCCSTGVCGPSADPALAIFAADLTWLSDQGVQVERHNLSQEPKAFADEELVRTLLSERGDKALPVILVDGTLRSSGRYPSRAELEAWALGSEAGASLGMVTAEKATSQTSSTSQPSQSTGGCCSGDSEPVDVPLAIGVAARQPSSKCCG